jgi:riboflavin kinase/FMN adenylyltransferase
MPVYRDIDHLPLFQRAVITIGTFDGVHRGHLQIINQLLEEARAVSGTPVLITFYPHPKQVIDNGKAPLYLLTTPDERYRLLEDAGIEHIVEVPFTREFSEQHAFDYIRDFLVEKFRPHTIIIGYDHRFGRDREGDYRLLESHAASFGYRVKEIPEHILRDVAVSSTRIRNALLAGDVVTACEYLGYPYFFHARVIQGDKRGRSIGYPTANLVIEHERKLIPANGVYAVTVQEDKYGTFRGMMNIGLRPTVNGRERSIEVHLFDFDADIYGSRIRVAIHHRIRDEIRFSGMEELKQQLDRDKDQVLGLF